MRLVLIPLLLLMFTAIFYQSVALSSYGIDDVSVSNETSLSGGLWENDTESGVEVEGYTMAVGIDAGNGVFVVLIAGIAVAVVAGIRVLGSGLSEFSVRMISKVTLFYCFWLFFSLFAITAFDLFPLGLGWLFYIVMTLVYSFGVVETLE